MRSSPHSPLAAIGLGVAAGIGGTAVMTAVQMIEAKLKGSGPSEAPETWEDAPAPAQVGERIADGVFDRPLPVESAPLVTNVMHWSYGTMWGVSFGVVQASLGLPLAPAALGFGTLVWASDYVILPAMKLYEPAWKYPAGTLAVDLARHLAYGAGVAGTWGLLTYRRRPKSRVQRLRALVDHG